ncbi:MAG: prepilin peptidase [Clostridium sp.]|nr:prepilin peptidase [Clostridium sp.]
MDLYIGIFVFICGLIFGSFYNVCISRIPEGESISYPPSHCTSCGNRLKWYDLVPVLSFLSLKGRCRYCKAKLSFRYPLMEIITGIIFLAVYLKYGYQILTLKYIVFSSILIIIGMIDYDTTDVYFSTIIAGTVCGIIFLFADFYFKQGSTIMSSVEGAALGLAVIYAIVFTTHGMGSGDAEICFVCGLFLGFKLTVLMLFLSFVIGGVTGVLLILLKIKSRKDYMPFGPSIALASMVTVIFGQNMISFYMKMITG